MKLCFIENTAILFFFCSFSTNDNHCVSFLTLFNNDRGWQKYAHVSYQLIIKTKRKKMTRTKKAYLAEKCGPAKTIFGRRTKYNVKSDKLNRNPYLVTPICLMTSEARWK